MGPFCNKYQVNGQCKVTNKLCSTSGHVYEGVFNGCPGTPGLPHDPPYYGIDGNRERINPFLGK